MRPLAALALAVAGIGQWWRWPTRKVSPSVSTEPDPQAQHIAALEKELAALKGLCAAQKARIQEAEVDMLVSLAIEEGKLLADPPMRKWAVDLGRRNCEALREFLERSPVLPSFRSGSGS